MANKNPIKQIEIPTGANTTTTYDVKDNTLVAGTNVTITDNADGTRSINGECHIVEITDANVQVYNLGSGIYKLSYNGTRTIQYRSSNSYKHTVVAKSDQPVYLYVSRNSYGGATDRIEWWYYSLKIYDGVYTSATTAKIVRYGGWSVTVNGDVYEPRVEELSQSALRDTNIANRIFLSTTNNGIGKWSDSDLGAGFVKTNSSGVVSIDTNTYATTSTVNGKAPTSHASTATTYGVGTTSKYGHVKTQTGDLNGTTSTDGVAAGLGHTHSQYLTSLETGTIPNTLTTSNGILVYNSSNQPRRMTTANAKTLLNVPSKLYEYRDVVVATRNFNIDAAVRSVSIRISFLANVASITCSNNKPLVLHMCGGSAGGYANKEPSAEVENDTSIKISRVSIRCFYSVPTTGGEDYYNFEPLGFFSQYSEEEDPDTGDISWWVDVYMRFFSTTAGKLYLTTQYMSTDGDRLTKTSGTITGTAIN